MSPSHPVSLSQPMVRPARRGGFRDNVSRQLSQPHGWLGPLAGLVLALGNRKINRRTVELLRVEPRDLVLEIGFGPGTSIRALSRLAHRGCVAGVDESEVMVRAATRRNRAAIAAARVTLRRGGVSSLPYCDRTFDKVMAVNSAQHWPTPENDFRQVYRVLRPGGRVALTLGQPRWAARPLHIQTLAAKVGGHLRYAGLTIERLELDKVGRQNCFFLVATRPPDPAPDGAA